MLNLGTYVCWNFDELQPSYGHVVGYGTVHHAHHAYSPTKTVSSVYLAEDRGGKCTVVNVDGIRRAGHVIQNGDGHYLSHYKRDVLSGVIEQRWSLIDAAIVFETAIPGRQSLFEDVWYQLYDHMDNEGMSVLSLRDRELNEL